MKLWNIDNLNEPIFEFFTSSYDYVCDVQWSPVNPALFSTITSGGKLSIWNISKSQTEPIDTVTIIKEDESEKASSSKLLAKNSGGGALNKSVWSQDGLSILVADSTGVVHTIAVDPNFALSNTSDEGKFEIAILSNTKKESSSKAKSIEFTQHRKTPSDPDAAGHIRRQSSNAPFEKSKFGTATLELKDEEDF